MSDGARVELSWQEVLIAAHVGCLRRVCSLRDQRRARHGVRDHEAWSNDVLGALGECAFAKWRRAYWSVGRFRTPDVEHYEIRTTPYDAGALLLHDDDTSEAPYVLVTGGSSRSFVLRGWIYGRDAKQPARWGTNGGKLYEPAYVVPQSELRAMRDLPREQAEGIACLR